MRYDVGVIGAGADGLAAAALLARAGYKTVVIERAGHAGGRCVTCEFAPGFFASPYTDTVAAVPLSLRALLGLDDALFEPLARPGADVQRHLKGALAQVLKQAAAPAPQNWLARLHARLWDETPSYFAWPGADWAQHSIAQLRGPGAGVDSHVALAGRAADPALAGSALTLFAAPQMRVRQGGLGALAALLEARARAAGAELRFGLEASEIRTGPRGVAGIVLGDGTAVETAALISTLDFKRTVLGLFRWSELGEDLVRAAGAWRMAGARARLLLAFDTPPGFSKSFFVPGDSDARAAFRRGVIPARAPMLVDPVSARDASLAPPGAAVVTLTLGCVPARLFDGGWTAQKRQLLLDRALGALHAASSMTGGPLPRLAAAATIVPPDIEEALGLSGGDLDGGVLAPDQMLAFRPGPRTPVEGLYLAGPSSAAGPLGLAAAGVAAAVAFMADRPRKARS